VVPSASNDRHLLAGDNMFKYWDIGHTVGWNTRSTPATTEFSHTPVFDQPEPLVKGDEAGRRHRIDGITRL